MIHGINADGPTACPVCGARPSGRRSRPRRSTSRERAGRRRTAARPARRRQSSLTRRTTASQRRHGRLGKDAAGPGEDASASGGLSRARIRDSSARTGATKDSTAPLRSEKREHRPAPRRRRRRTARPRPGRPATDVPTSAADWITPGRGGRDPRGREHPVQAVDDRRLGSHRQAPEHQARRPAVRPAGRGQGAARAAAARPGERPATRPVRGDSRLIDDGRVPRPGRRDACASALLTVRRSSSACPGSPPPAASSTGSAPRTAVCSQPGSPTTRFSR